MRHKGVNAGRLTREPLEARFAKQWQQQNDYGNTLAHILNVRGDGRPAEPSERDAEVAATVIQWLGSHVGQNFLRDVMGDKS